MDVGMEPFQSKASPRACCSNDVAAYSREDEEEEEEVQIRTG